ncbi:sigma-54-dependent Fis family transcriptional regulator [bacterium]|nr:sigma-54-dependent Fis family transcriptional regulator [bacterium]
MTCVILIVDEATPFRRSVVEALTAQGYDVHEAPSARDALELIERLMPALVLVDVRARGRHGEDLLAAIRERHPAISILAVADEDEVRRAACVLERGAEGLLERTLTPEQVVMRVTRALEHSAEPPSLAGFPDGMSLDAPGEAGGQFDVMLGQSAPMRAVYGTIRRLSRSDSTTVLIQGESGTGKELAAGAIHMTSARRERPFVAVNCAALTESLLESELFGYEKGAFTGAAATGKAGLFEAADGGTIFLDEIGEMGLNLQSKLLRVLQNRVFMRVGGTANIAVNVRVVASTNRQLSERVREGGFRQDLFFRLQVVTITMPPLRDRPEDILPLAQHFVAEFGQRFGCRMTGFTKKARRLLVAYPWPGNVRELRNAIERCVVLDGGGQITDHYLRLDSACLLAQDVPARATPAALGSTAAPPSAPRVPREADLSLASVERSHIVHVLNATMWQRGRAADLLGIHRTTLANKIREYGLADEPAPVSAPQAPFPAEAALA